MQHKPGYPIDPRIIRFIRKHHVFTLATSINDQPWCSSCFYTYVEESGQFIFTTDLQTKHGQQMQVNNHVAGNIVLETKIIGKIKGIQFSGKVRMAEGTELEVARKHYLKKFPVAVLMEISLWILLPMHIKMTDNLLGFGKKLIWNRLPESDGVVGIF